MIQGVPGHLHILGSSEQLRAMFRPATSPPTLFTLILLTGVSVLALNMFLPSLANIATDLNADYALGTDTTIKARYNINGGVDGFTGVGTLGLQQKWNILTGLKLDFGYQYTFENFGRTGNDLQFRQPFAVGQGASGLGTNGQTAFNVGFEYTDDADFKVSGRWERRHLRGLR